MLMEHLQVFVVGMRIRDERGNCHAAPCFLGPILPIKIHCLREFVFYFLRMGAFQPKLRGIQLRH
jgi:hypothetical protein